MLASHDTLQLVVLFDVFTNTGRHCYFYACSLQETSAAALVLFLDPF